MTGGAPNDLQSRLRRLPKLDRLLLSDRLAALNQRRGWGFVGLVARGVLDEWRERLRGGTGPIPDDLHEAIVVEVERRLARDFEPLPRILNGTGVLLNSGLGRAPLPQAAVAALSRAGGYSLLEVDREAGRRRSRDSRAGELLCALTGAEAALVVNNNAAATMLILSALAAGREVICSRGEMVEIGGSYRIPDVMTASGCRLVEVGTTNKTHAPDYERAIGEETGALLVVHTSNYRVVGFTAAPALEDIARIARAHGLPAIHDLGSGSLLSPEELGFGDEPPVQHSFKAGMDVVCMSGDKLLGGPQAGIILGRADLVTAMRKHPLARALRVDKMTLAALEATLQLFFDRDRLRAEHPVIRMLTTPAEQLHDRAEALAADLTGRFGPAARAEVLQLTSETGSGALPTLEIPSAGVGIETELASAERFSRALRHASPGVFPRIVADRVAIDLRTIFPEEDKVLAGLLEATLKELARP